MDNKRYRYNVESGLLEPAPSPQPPTTVSWELYQEDYARKLLGAAHGKTLPRSQEGIDQYLGEQLASVNGELATLAESRIELPRPGVVFHVGEEALTLERRLGVLDDHALLKPCIDEELEWLKKWLPRERRQQLPTGLYLQLDRGSVMRGQSQGSMLAHTEMLGDKISQAIVGRTALLLGLIPNYDRFGGSRTAQIEEYSGSIIYTPEITTSGDIVGLRRNDYNGAGVLAAGCWGYATGLAAGCVVVVPSPSTRS